MSSPSRREVRVAIVGSGLTGLIATYLLSSHKPNSADAPRISVEIFERASTLGMDSASITVPMPLASSASNNTIPPPPPASSSTLSSHNNDHGVRLRSHKRPKLQISPPTSSPDTAQKNSQTFLHIDVPMRAFTGGYYPQLLALYRHLGISTKKTNFTYSFASLPPPSHASASIASTRSSSPSRPSTATEKPTACNPTPSPNIIYNGANGLRGVSLPSSLRNPSFPTPITISAILHHLASMRSYFSSLLTLILAYIQLLIIALWHHNLGHTSDSTHPLGSCTLQQLVQEPFPLRVAPCRFSIRHSVENGAEAILRRIVGLDQRFAEQTLAPLFSAVMTCTLHSVWSCPATEVLDYVALTLGKDHFVVKDGVRTVVAALLTHLPYQKEGEGREGVWTNAEVRSVCYRDRAAYLSVLHHPSPPPGQGEGEMLRQSSISSATTDATFVEHQEEASEREHGPYDHIIFATQANQTAHFLAQYRESMRNTTDKESERQRLEKVSEALGRFNYEKSTVVNHIDPDLLPAERADWRDLNLVTPQCSSDRRRDSKRSDWTDDSPSTPSEDSSNDTLYHRSSPRDGGGYTMATHLLTPPSPSHSTLLLMQTTNPHPSLLPHPSLTLSTSTFERAVIDIDSHLARQELFHFSTPTSKHESVRTAGGRNLILGPLQKRQHRHVGVWVCGSWAVGIPLLEGCVVSARLVGEEIARLEGVQLADCVKW